MAKTWDEVGKQQEIEQLQSKILQIQRESQLKLEALQRQTEQQLTQLQAQIDQLSAAAEAQPTASGKSSQAVQHVSAEPVGFRENLEVSGDFRLRYEYNSDFANVPSWDRGVLRGRLAARYSLTDNFRIGARMVTGDPDNPRTSDVTIGDFVSDFELSLDQAYASLNYGNTFLTGGKFAKPFRSTELVWDGDVNPQGLGGHYDFNKGDDWSARFSGIYFNINQSIFDKGSDMFGGQFSLEFQPNENWDLAVNTAFYDYEIGSLDPDVPGGARGNNVTPDGRYYVSDFNLFDVLGSATYKGFGDRWKVRFVGDYVKNLGAEVPEDTGYGFDLFVGGLSQPGRFLFRYGYSMVETDAVLGMFSNDNIVFPTNYELHAFSIDYVLHPHTFLGLTNYFYRREDQDRNPAMFPNDWLSRTRVNLYFTF
jgi:hypothetical protein